MREDKSSPRLAETILTGGRQELDVRGLSQRRLEDRITPAHLVEGLSSLTALLRFARDAPCGRCGSAPRGRDTDRRAGEVGGRHRAEPREALLPTSVFPSASAPSPRRSPGWLASAA